jgi:DNA polymerase-3 subunit delta
MEIKEPPAAEKLLNFDIVILHGEEEMGIQLALQQILSSKPQDGMAGMNLTRLDGQTVGKNDLHNHLNLLPFGAEKRLVVIDNALAQAKSKEEQDEFIRLLDSLPPTTRLVMVISDEWVREKGKRIWQSLHKQTWLTKWLAENKNKTVMLDFNLPTAQAMIGWVEAEVKRQGGTIDSRASRELANAMGTETLLISHEIEKLLIYTERQRPITVEDVRELCTPIDREDIFAMTDAIAQGDARTALRLLDISLKNQTEPAIFSMIVAHFRNLIIYSEMAADGFSAKDIALEYRKPDFVVVKMIQQSRRFTMNRLEEIYQRLADLDIQLKDNRMPPDLALELFVGEMDRK